MALTKAQVSLVSVATLGVAAGGYTAQLAAFNTQKEAAAFIATTGLLNAGTNAEFVNTVAGNLNNLATKEQKAAFYKALEDGASRSDAAVDFANAQLVAQGGKIANVDKAIASTSTSMDLNALKAEITPVDAALTVKFKDTNKDQDTELTTGQTIQNIGKAQIDAGQDKKSNDFTFELKNQIGNATFKGEFLSPILDREKAGSTGSQLYLELLDLRAAADGKEPLERVPVDAFAFTLDGSQVLIQSDAIFAAKTYDALFAAVKARVAELGNGVNVPTLDSLGNPANAEAYAKLGGFTVELGGNFTVQNEAGKEVSGKQIILTDTAGSTLKAQGFINKAGVIADPGYTLYAQMNNEAPQEVFQYITTNLVADNVGYGSQGATVNLVGQSASNKGIEEIKVITTNDSWFTKLQSEKTVGSITTNHLARVEVQSGSEGYFNIGTQKAGAKQTVVSLVDQNFSAGGLTDVQQVDAGNAGSAAINSFVSKDVLGRYELKDTGIYTADDSKAAISYNLSSGNDVLNLAISTDVLEAVDTKVSVNTGAGDDVITVFATNTSGSTKAANTDSGNAGWLINQQLNKNIKIDAGSGNDWILTPGAGNMTIDAGAGDDVVRVDNAGKKGVFVFNNATTNINKLLTNQDIVSNSDNKLSNGANGTAQTFNFFKAQVQVTFKGFESKFIEIANTDYTTNTKQINQAIKKAINDDPVLKNLITAYDNEGNALGIESQIDGLLAEANLSIKIIAPTAYSATAETEAAKAAREKAGSLLLGKDDQTNADKAYIAKGGSAGSVTTTAAENLYASEFGTTGTNTATTVTTTKQGVAEVFEVQNFAAATIAVGTGETFTFKIDGVDVVYTPTSPITAGNFASALAAGLTTEFTGTGVTSTAAGTVTVNGSTYTFAPAVAPAAITDLVITQSVAGKNIAAITGTSSAATPVLLPAPTAGGTAKDGVAPVNEVQTLDFSAVTVAGGETLIFTTAGAAGGLAAAVTYTNGSVGDPALTGATLAAAVAADPSLTGDANTTITYTAGSSVVTVTYDLLGTSAGKDVAEIVVTGTGAGTPAVKEAGSFSTAESDNIINLGDGNDLLVMGTGALSNDTLKVDGYNLGTSTIVNFTAGAPAANNGADLIDFSAYLTSVNATTKATITKTVSGISLKDNAVAIVDFNAASDIKLAGKVISFKDLTADNVKSMINKGTTTPTGDNYGSLDLDTVAGVAGSTSNYVLMVQNNTNNNGEYKAFHVTSAGTSTDAADVKLIGTFDFGATITLIDANLA